MKTLIGLLAGIILGAGGVLGVQMFDGGHGGHQPYRDEQGRPITSLSADDVRQLEAGEGWGLAKPAEFNGYPGPAHILEFAGKLDLTETQLAGVKTSFETMRARARTLGSQLVEAEKALDGAFVGRSVTPDILRDRLATIESLRADLRRTHLTAHLEVTPLLTDRQKARYDELRGYGGHKGH